MKLNKAKELIIVSLFQNIIKSIYQPPMFLTRRRMKRDRVTVDISRWRWLAEVGQREGVTVEKRSTWHREVDVGQRDRVTVDISRWRWLADGVTVEYRSVKPLQVDMSLSRRLQFDQWPSVVVSEVRVGDFQQVVWCQMSYAARSPLIAPEGDALTLCEQLTPSFDGRLYCWSSNVFRNTADEQ